MSEAPMNESFTQPVPFEIGPEQLAVILAPDEVLAAQSLDRSIQVAEADPGIAAEALDLLRFQRSLVDMDPRNAYFKAVALTRRAVGGRTPGSDQGDGRLGTPLYDLNRDTLLPDIANSERWRAVGINPKEYYGDDAYGRSHINGVQESWRAAREARAALAAAQAAEVEAMKNVINPPALEPRA